LLNFFSVRLCVLGKAESAEGDLDVVARGSAAYAILNLFNIYFLKFVIVSFIAGF
jgi:hypothetical protein